MKNLQKSLSLFLCIVLCLSLFPVAGFAEGSEAVCDEITEGEPASAEGPEEAAEPTEEVADTDVVEEEEAAADAEPEQVIPEDVPAEDDAEPEQVIPEDVPAEDDAVIEEAEEPEEDAERMTGSTEQVEGFVRRGYSLMLGREADADGLKFYVDLLTSGQLSGAQLVSSFMNSPEFNSNGYTNEQVVTIVYRTMLSRDPDPDGLRYHTNNLNNGICFDSLINNFSRSQEFTGICTNAGIVAGSLDTEWIDLNPQVAAFVMRNYQLALNRRAAGSELNYYCEILLNRMQTPQQVAHNFVFSPECVSRNLNNRDFTTMLYHLYMDRDPDVSGMNYYLDALAHGATREQVEAGFAYSKEFKRIVEGYGIIVPTYIISFNANGGTGAPASQEKIAGEVITLSSTVPKRTNKSENSYTVMLNANGGTVSKNTLTATRTTSFSFINWNTQVNGTGTSYNPGASYTADANATLYAQWSSYTATSAVTLPTPTRTNYIFKGWATSASASSGVKGSYTPNGNVTLYAIWDANTKEGVYTPVATNYGTSLLSSPLDWVKNGHMRAGLAIWLYYDLPASIRNTKFENALNNGDVYMNKRYTSNGDLNYILIYYTSEQLLFIGYSPAGQYAVYQINPTDNISQSAIYQTSDWKINRSDVIDCYNTMSS